jgi:hypothetical protein
MSPEARDHSFDELTRGLARGTLSRGKALRLMGAALVGGALASIPGIAWAKPKPADAKCNHDKQCASGQCVDGVCQGGTCPRPQLTAGDCNCAARCGDTDPLPFACQDNPNCACTGTTEGSGFCAHGPGTCDTPCSSSSECPPGSKCIVNTCCLNSSSVCAPPCSPATSSA